MNIDELVKKISEYNKENIEIIKKAFYYAESLHSNQIRESGEPYIVHPLNVAYILAEMHADSDTICAALLHDTLEDTNTTKEEISYEFNPNIASLVDGVTKISKMNFSSKKEQNLANTRKILTSLSKDVRIIIIKLADRLHNMRTLQYKTEFKQKENALETMEIYVPLAYYIGAYRIKSELEDLSFQYLKPDIYKRLLDKKIYVEKESQEALNEMLFKIKSILSDNSIPNEIKVRTKNIYGIYKRLNEGYKLFDIHDLLALKIMVDEVYNCYHTLGLIHSIYYPINEKFKDYICNSKTNKYRSLHTTVFGPDNKLVQTQIRTFDMDKIASFGLTAYWEKEKDNARNVMQEELKNKFQFYKSLNEIDTLFYDNQEYVNQVKNELFSSNIYVYTTNGETIELPKGSTIVDFAYKVDSELGNTMIGAFVNDKYVQADYVLQNKDRVRVVTDEFAYPKEEWVNIAQTSLAKRKIKEYYKY